MKESSDIVLPLGDERGHERRIRRLARPARERQVLLDHRDPLRPRRPEAQPASQTQWWPQESTSMIYRN